MLNKLQLLIDELNSTNSSNAKKAILPNHATNEVKELLVYTYDKINKTYGVTSDNLIKRDDLVSDCNLNIVELLDQLDSRAITGHTAIATVNGFIAKNPTHKQLVYNIIDRDLKTRVTGTIINKVWKGLIPEFKVALADSYKEKEKFVDFKKQTWFSSRKLDGCRCVIIKTKTSIKAISRQGKEFLTLNNLLKNFPFPVGVYDGEICIVDDNGDEQFQGIMKEIKKKDHTIEKPRYKMFDALTIDEFYSKTSKRIFSERYKAMQQLDKDYLSNPATEAKLLLTDTYIDVVEQTIVKDDEHFDELQKEAVEGGWEGLIIREDMEYEGKRSRHMLKVKSFFDGEFEAKEAYFSTKRMLEDGIMVEKDTLKGVYIDFKGFRVGVGSGWSDAERLEYFAHPENIVGKILTVRYFEPTENERGTTSMRFPTKKWVFDGERDV